MPWSVSTETSVAINLSSKTQIANPVWDTIHVKKDTLRELSDQAITTLVRKLIELPHRKISTLVY